MTSTSSMTPAAAMAAPSARGGDLTSTTVGSCVSIDATLVRLTRSSAAKIRLCTSAASADDSSERPRPQRSRRTGLVGREASSDALPLERKTRCGSKSSNDSKGAADGGGSPDLDRSGGNRLKSDRSNQSLRNAEKENSKSSAKNSGNNDSGNNSSSNNSNSKAGGSLPSISSNAGGRLSDLSGNRNAPNTDSPLPPIIANTKNSDSSKNDHDSSSSSKVTQSHSTSNLSSKTYGNSSSHRGNQRSKKPSQPSKSSNYSTGGSTNREKRRHKQSKYGAYGSSMYKSKSKHRSSGNSGVGGSSLGGGVYGSSGGGTNFSVLGQGHKAQLKAYKSSKGRSKRGRGSSLQPQWASKKY